MDLLFYIIAGAGVGFLVGLTGVGGGSLMTPLLIFWGIPQKIAIGTDLIYAALTKTGAAWSHQRLGSIRWKITFLLASGSIPAAIATSFALKWLAQSGIDYAPILTKSLGVMLILTGCVLFIKRQIQQVRTNTEIESDQGIRRHKELITVLSGLILGIFVTLSSVGAGAFCVVLLLTLYPRLPALQIVGTDIAHAVPLTFVAGTGHWLLLDALDLNLLVGLLIGSLPAVQIGAKLASRIPGQLLQTILAIILIVIGSKFIFF